MGTSLTVNITTGNLIEQYTTELLVLRRSTNTIRIRRIQVANWLTFLTACGLSPLACTRWDVIRFLSRYEDPETRSAYRSAVRGFQSWLMAAGYRDDDPSVRIPTIRLPEGDPHPIPDDVLLAAMAEATPRIRSMLVLGRFAGLRAAEIAAASRDYLLHRPTGPVVRLQGKGGRWRELPAHPEVVRVLAGPGWVFPHGAGHIQGDTVSRELSGVLDPWTAHSLRHAFATEAYRRTRDLRLVQGWLGHASPLTTVRYIEAEQDWAAMGRLALVS